MQTASIHFLVDNGEQNNLRDYFVEDLLTFPQTPEYEFTKPVEILVPSKKEITFSLDGDNVIETLYYSMICVNDDKISVPLHFDVFDSTVGLSQIDFVISETLKTAKKAIHFKNIKTSDKLTYKITNRLLPWLKENEYIEVCDPGFLGVISIHKDLNKFGFFVVLDNLKFCTKEEKNAV